MGPGNWHDVHEAQGILTPVKCEGGCLSVSSLQLSSTLRSSQMEEHPEVVRRVINLFPLLFLLFSKFSLITFKKNIYCAFRSQLKDTRGGGEHSGFTWYSLSPPGLKQKVDTGARF